MGYYENATICLNGHVASSSTSNYRKFCKECGKETISTCRHCESNIQDDYNVPGVVTLGRTYNTPSFCHECGEPFPWTEMVIANAVELISLDDELPEEYKKIIKTSFPDLVVETPHTPVAVAKYKKYMPQAAEYIQNGIKTILYDVASEAVKKAIRGN